MTKLIAIGDSLTQGFQSGAIFQTAWSYPAMIARSMGLNIPSQFRVPSFPGSGLPINLEELLNFMQRHLGPDINTLEWIVRFPVLLGQFLDETENIYERGAGARPAAFGGVYHNLAVWGFRVADAFTITSDYCRHVITDEEGFIEDDFLGVPSAPMYRTARRVLNPRQRPEREHWTVLDNLRHLVQEDPNLENLILWLGANDCLGTVLELNVKDMDTTSVSDDPRERRRWNLMHEQVFAQDYARLVEKIREIIPPETNVFVANIPHVTIPPVTQGIPPFKGKYFPYYGRFFSTKDNFNPLWQACITGDDAAVIDERINKFNATIKRIVEEQGWHLVDMCKILDALAVKRNEMEDAPGRPLRDYYADLKLTDHPLLRLSPIPNILRLRTTKHGKRQAGGLFSLDCFHPSTIGYGIVAEAFLRVMQEAGVSEADPARLNWSDIIAHDALLQQPPLLWDDITEAAERNATLWDLIFRVIV